MGACVALLGLPFLMCLAMTAILGYLGIHVLKREVVFIDIALAQMAALGAIVAHALVGAGEGSLGSYGCAFGAVVLAAGFYALARRRVGQVSLEVVIGVSYAIGAAAALFLLGVAPGGHVHLREMLAGSILWTTWGDLARCAIVFALAGAAFWLLRRPFGRISEDYEGAVRSGVRTAWWDFAFYTLVGLVITVAVRVGGVVVVFAFLIIPATVSALFATGWRGRLAIAWATAVVGSAGGLLLARALDFSPGPAVAAVLGFLLVVAALARILSMCGTTSADPAEG